MYKVYQHKTIIDDELFTLLLPIILVIYTIDITNPRSYGVHADDFEGKFWLYI